MRRRWNLEFVVRIAVAGHVRMHVMMVMVVGAVVAGLRAARVRGELRLCWCGDGRRGGGGGWRGGQVRHTGERNGRIAAGHVRLGGGVGGIGCGQNGRVGLMDIGMVLAVFGVRL